MTDAEKRLLESIDPQAEAIEEVLAAEGPNCLTKDCANAPTVTIENDAGTFHVCPDHKAKYMPKPKRSKKEPKE